MSSSSNPGSTAPVVVVDDHDLIGESLVMALNSQELNARRLRVESQKQILKVLTNGPPGVVLLDLDLGKDRDGHPIDGLNLVGDLTGHGWHVIIISGSRWREHVAAAIAAGAVGYIPKSAPLPDLVEAVIKTLNNCALMTENERSYWQEIHRRNAAIREKRAELLDRLAPREREVLDLLARGLRVAAIAERFVVSEATVRTQVKSILKKLGVNSQIEAVALHRTASR